QPLPIHSWKLIFPWVVSAVKLGASLLILRAISDLRSRRLSRDGRPGQGAAEPGKRRFSRVLFCPCPSPAPPAAAGRAPEPPGPGARRAGFRALRATAPTRVRAPKISSRRASHAEASWRAAFGPRAATGRQARGAPTLSASGRLAGEPALYGLSPCGRRNR